MPKTRIRNPVSINPAASKFRRLHYPEATFKEWTDWRWQLRNRLKAPSDLANAMSLSVGEALALTKHRDALPLGITPYYAHLMDRDDAMQGLRRTHVPDIAEYSYSPGEADDPLGENSDEVVPGLVHRYPDRVLFLATGFCATFCRYCTRSRLVGAVGNGPTFGNRQWEHAIQYIESRPLIRDVLISGGDPLTLSDDKIDWLLTRLRAIPHVELVRIGTKVPMVLPMRVTGSLARILGRHRIWLSLHATHPDELTPEAEQAISRLADRGVSLGSQTVLLKGVNDSVATMKALMHGLVRNRVKPLYLYQMDPISGSSHFRTPVQTGLDIISGLRGHTTGYAVPQYVIDAPGGGGKIPLQPNYIVGRDGDDLLLRNYEGRLFRYPDPGGSVGSNQELRSNQSCDGGTI